MAPRRERKREREHDGERQVQAVLGDRAWPRKMPAMPTIDPIDRSNSPAIMSRATGAPRMPDLGRDLELAGDAEGPRKPFLLAE